MEAKPEQNNLLSRATGKAGLFVAAPYKGEIPESNTCIGEAAWTSWSTALSWEAATNIQISYLVHEDNSIPTDKNNRDFFPAGGRREHWLGWNYYYIQQEHKRN